LVSAVSRHLTTIRKVEKGQSIIEFALFLPLILFVIFVAIQISMVAYYRLALNQILTDLARTISVTENPEEASCQNRVESILTFYSEHTMLSMQVDNSSIFTWNWTRETTPEQIDMVIITGTYHGMQLPFIGEYQITDSVCYPTEYSVSANP